MNVKGFMFGWIHLRKSELKNNFQLKSTFRIKATNSGFKIESVMEAKSILLKSNQTRQNQFYTFRINSGCSECGTNFFDYDTLLFFQMLFLLSQ